MWDVSFSIAFPVIEELYEKNSRTDGAEFFLYLWWNKVLGDLASLSTYEGITFSYFVYS